jgi:hypothetical protein
MAASVVQPSLIIAYSQLNMAHLWPVLRCSSVLSLLCACLARRRRKSSHR